jgi:tRNA (guanine37-N1)-methyltransferase
VREAQDNPGVEIPALLEGLADVEAWIGTCTTFVVRAGPRLVGAVRGRLVGDAWDVGRLMVAPDLRGRGLGRWLLAHVEAAAPPEATTLSLVTGAGSASNLRMYKRAGYRRDRVQDEPGVVHLSKPAR